MKTLFFVHIPKTAGTSFRLGAVDYFGKGSTCYDYGLEAGETSLLIKKHIYTDGDSWALSTAFKEQGIRFLAGHVDVNKYIYQFGSASTISFVRDPIQRIISDFNHFVRHHGYEQDFKDFYRNPLFINRQFKFLQGIPVPALGVIGITERYSDSIELINKSYNYHIPIIQTNVGKNDIKDIHSISVEDENELNQLNALDISLYKQCYDLFDIRWELMQKGTPYAHCHIAQVTPINVNGWAWWEQNDTPVVIEVLVNGILKGSTKCVDFRTDLCCYSVSRSGYVGFTFSLNVKYGDKISCKVSNTGQECFNSPIEVLKPLEVISNT